MPKVRYLTIWLALIMIAVFVLQSIFPAFESAFVLDKSAVWHLEIWRFVTSIFLHGSIIHLLSNLFALLLFGIILEKFIGSNKFLLVFFVSGILANVVAWSFYPQSLGASGAIMGIIGTLAIVRPMMTVWAFGVIMPMAVAAVVWVFVDAIGVFIPDNTGHIAHLSGIFFGILFGLIFWANREQRKKRHSIEIPEHLLRKWETLYMGVD